MFTLYYRNKKRFRRAAITGYIIIALVTILPILSVVLAGVLADSHDCVLNEGSAHPCIIGGSDYGGTLYFLGSMGWFFFASLPLGIGALVIWTKKVRQGRQFIRDGAWYNLSELKNVTTNEFDGRLYLEGWISNNEKPQPVRLFFKNMDEQRRFSTGFGIHIGGILRHDENSPILILYDSIVR